ncbi:MAG: hypothetical protein IPH74_14405 [Bacteroidetes bacterium]|nr:hypothetical protein [Bacteroidota bacterium]
MKSSKLSFEGSWLCFAVMPDNFIRNQLNERAAIIPAFPASDDGFPNVESASIASL